MSKASQTRVILELLRHRHSGLEWATFVELNEGTGSFGGRRIDFFAFNLWPSKKYLKIAYEIKVSRSDFFKELDDPRKREPAERLANECYFATPVGMVQPDEVPEGWGLIEMIANGLRIKKRAQQRQVDTLPMPFVASLARQSSLPDPELPVATWLLAGQEITRDDLLEAAGTVKERVIRDLRFQLREEFRKSDEYEALRDLRQVIGRYAGYGISRDSERFEEWLKENMNGSNGEERPPVPHFYQRQISTAYRALGKMMEAFDIEEDISL